ncbi:MAG: glycoside hydrolase family 3 N-terminal domain-containing protein [Gemmatimonadota bacterium]
MSTGAAGLHERLCRLVCVPVRDHEGPGADELLADRQGHPWGGYIFFGGDLGAVHELIARLREASPEPLLLASDLERGLGQQLRGATSFPPPMALGAAGDPELCREVGLATAREASAIGLNAAFAPVLDLADEPANPIVCTRAFGDDPHVVRELGAALIRGLQEGGVLTTAKHFPGHGRTRLDSHAELPLVRASAEELRERDLEPFRGAIQAGVGLVMSAHVAYPALEAERAGHAAPAGPPLPATLSGRILHDLLREELDFRGAVVSDALMMGAVAGAEPAELAARALEAGIDCLLYPSEPHRVVAGLARRVSEGRLAEEVAQHAALRIASALGRLAPPGHAVEVPSAYAAELAARAATRGLVAIGGPVLPVSAGRVLVLLLLDGGIAREQVVLPRVAAGEGREFRWALPEEGPVEPPSDLAGFDAVLLAHFSPIRAWKGRAGLSAAARSYARAVFESRPDAGLLSFSSPFILGELPPPRAALFAFGEAAECQVAVGEVLAGRGSPAGHLPVRV